MADKEENSPRAYRLLIKYTDTVDMAKKVLSMYNAFLVVSGSEETQPADPRHINLLAYYFVFGYSVETKRKFAHCFSVDNQYVSVLDTEMKKKGILIDRDGTYRTRALHPDIENMRRLFIIDGNRDMSALVSLFHRVKK